MDCRILFGIIGLLSLETAAHASFQRTIEVTGRVPQGVRLELELYSQSPNKKCPSLELGGIKYHPCSEDQKFPVQINDNGEFRFNFQTFKRTLLGTDLDLMTARLHITAEGVEGSTIEFIPDGADVVEFPKMAEIQFVKLELRDPSGSRYFGSTLVTSRGDESRRVATFPSKPGKSKIHLEFRMNEDTVRGLQFSSTYCGSEGQGNTQSCSISGGRESVLTCIDLCTGEVTHP